MEEKGIDFEIIWKKINSTLSKEEESELEEWLADEEHSAYFYKVKFQYLGRAKPEEEIEIPTLESISRTREYKRTKRVLYPVSVLAAIIVAIVYLIHLPNNDPVQTPVAQQSILPGSDKAILITSTGESIELNSETSLAVSDGNVNVSTNGKSIVYNQEGRFEEEVLNTLVIPKGGKFSLEMSDGTKVWINSDSRLEYPVAFSGKERVVSLEGEAYFEVTHDSQRPFIVLSKEQKVKVLGTSFNVTSYKETGQVLTTLVEGSVNVQLLNGSNSKILSPGMQSFLDMKTGSLSSHYVDVDQFVSWKDGWFVFDDQSLEEILNTLARWYNVDLFFVNAEAKKMKFTGEIERQEKIENIISLIEKTNAVKIEIKDRTVIVR